MTVEEAIAEASKRGLSLSALRQDEAGWWIAGMSLNGGHVQLDRAPTAAEAVMKVAGYFPPLERRR